MICVCGAKWHGWKAREVDVECDVEYKDVCLN
jgi:hypothetical protein